MKKTYKTLACILLILLISIILKITVFSTMETFIENHRNNTETKTRDIKMEFDTIDNDIYALVDPIKNKENNIYKLQNKEWTNFEGPLTLTNISSNSEHIWGIDKSGGVHRCKKPCKNNNWENLNDLQDLKLLDMGVNNKYIYGLKKNEPEDGSSNFYKCDLTTGCQELNNWNSYGDDGYKLDRLAVNNDSVWGINKTTIYKCKDDNCGIKEVPIEESTKSLKNISANSNSLWGIDKKNNITQYKNKEWKNIIGSLKQISVNDNVAMGVNEEGVGYKCDVDNCDFQIYDPQINDIPFKFISVK